MIFWPDVGSNCLQNNVKPDLDPNLFLMTLADKELIGFHSICFNPLFTKWILPSDLGWSIIYIERSHVINSK